MTNMKYWLVVAAISLIMGFVIGGCDNVDIKETDIIAVGELDIPEGAQGDIIRWQTPTDLNE